MSSMVLLQEDVMYEILLRLPATSILNCKCVCKTWFSLISNPSFVKQHLDGNKKQSKLMFIMKDGTKPYYPLVSTVSYDDTLYSSSFMSTTRDEIDPPFEDLAYPTHLLGSCNGLVCIMFQTSMVDGWVPFFVIWNPTTTEYKILPHSQNRVTYQKNFSIYSFGYDRKNDDYKFVKGEFLQDGVVKLPPGEEDVHVSEVYSLQSDSWRSIETIPYHMLKYIPFDGTSGVLVNGLSHWLAKRKYLTRELSDDFVVSFDFSEEQFNHVHLPKVLKDRPNYRYPRTVGVLEECLCLICGVWDPGFQHEIWVMQDYGVTESWTKRLVIHQREEISNLDSPRVIWSFKDDKILLLKSKDKQKLVLYDPKQDTVSTTSSKVIRGVENYVESLVSLNSGIYVRSCQEYGNILRASWTKELRLFDYKELAALFGMTLVVLWLAMGSTIYFKTQTMRRKFGQFVMVCYWLNNGGFRLWWWKGTQPPLAMDRSMEELAPGTT